MKLKQALNFPEKDFHFFASMSKGFKPYKGLHTHSYALELHYFLGGSGAYFVKDRQYKVKNGSLLIIHANELHRMVSADAEEKIIKITTNLSPDIFNRYGWFKDFASGSILRCRKELPHVVQLKGFDITEAEYIFKALVREWSRKSPFWREAVVTLIVRLCVLVERVLRAGPEKKSNIPDKILAKAVAYIDTNTTRDIDLVCIAKEIGLSPNYLSSKFKKVTGTSIKEYIIANRINEAKKKLREEPETKIISVAYEAGFKDLSHFNHTFKKVTGYTPTEYKKLS